MNHGEINIAYILVMASLAISLIILGVFLSVHCKKKSDQFEETLPIKLPVRSYMLPDVDAATDGFSHRRIVGMGRLGIVYAGLFEKGELLAVKRIHPLLVLRNAGLGLSLVLKRLSLAQHPNIVPIIGFSEAPGERIILMEFAGMVTLEFYLHQNSDNSLLLDWNKRFKIAAGAGRGLQYLHEVAYIVHGCFKSSNVLIDVNFCARIFDYGLNFMTSTEKKGRKGYMDDEYWNERGMKVRDSKENDVYGFGLVLLELLSGRSCEEGLLAKWALPLIKEKRYIEVLDPRLAIPSDMKPLVRLCKVALACVGNSRKFRPSITEVAAILNNLEMEVCI